MSHGSAEQCVEGRAGAGAKMSAKSRMEDCGGERQPWLRSGWGPEGGLDQKPAHSPPFFIPQASFNDPLTSDQHFPFIKCFIIHLLSHFITSREVGNVPYFIDELTS